MNIRELYKEELAAVDEVILSTSSKETPLIGQVLQHVVSSGGKRLRPILTILSAKLCGYDGDRHIRLAAAIELLHTATLLHDDVVDESKLRRGQDTANEIWGNAASVLVGDYLLGKAFQLMAQDGSIKVLEILSDASAVITEGEVQQLMAINNIATDKTTYLEIISAKTAQLFAAACRVGAVVADYPEDKEVALEQFGQQLGVAFQIADDALDYSAKQAELGKTIGDDFREGKVTLPVILAYQRSTDEEKKFWERAMGGEQEGGDLDKAVTLMAEHDVLAATMDVAGEYVVRAEAELNSFNNSDVKTTLRDLLHFSVNRPY